MTPTKFPGLERSVRYEGHEIKICISVSGRETITIDDEVLVSRYSFFSRTSNYPFVLKTQDSSMEGFVGIKFYVFDGVISTKVVCNGELVDCGYFVLSQAGVKDLLLSVATIFPLLYIFYAIGHYIFHLSDGNRIWSLLELACAFLLSAKIGGYISSILRKRFTERFIREFQNPNKVE